jgi:CHAT domain-containing protein/tetratricopeptide (TPR) repeat protein
MRKLWQRIALMGLVTACLGFPSAAQADRYDRFEDRQAVVLNNRVVALSDAGQVAPALSKAQELLSFVSQRHGDSSLQYARALRRYALTLQGAQRYGAALGIYDRQIAILQSRLGADSEAALAVQARKMDALIGLGRWAEARNVGNEVGPKFLKLVGYRDPRAVNFVINSAKIYNELGDYDLARPVIDNAIKLASAVHGPESVPTLIARGIAGDSAFKAQRFAEAARIYAEIEPLWIKAVGPTDLSALNASGSLAAALMRVPGREREALPYAQKIKDAFKQMLARFSSDGASQQARTAALRYFVGIQVIYVDALYYHRDTMADAAELAFADVQQSLVGTTSQSVSRAAARRLASGDAVLRSLVAEREEAEAKLMAIETDLQRLAVGKAPVSAVMQPYAGAGLDTATQIQMARSQRDLYSGVIKAADITLENRFPDIKSIVQNEPLTLASAQALLKPDDAIFMAMPGTLGYHTILVTSDDVAWARTSLSREAINKLGERIAWDIGIEVGADDEEIAGWLLEGEGVYPFGFEAAHGLYEEILGGFESQLAGKTHLYTLAGGPLASIPLGVLVSEVPDGPFGAPETLRSAAWLADQFAILKMPSLRTIDYLRVTASEGNEADAPDRKPFIGIGDPVLAGSGATRSATPGLRRRGDQAGLRAFSLGNVTRSAGDLADPSTLRRLASLPGTRTELMRMAEIYESPADELFIADAASESRVRRTQLSANTITFATHGVTAGELVGMNEPGLILTPPQIASQEDDGYLSMSEIASLSIDASWVILSACNTASPDGSGQGISGLSGLARAFLYAGAESLMVSHWPVRDDVASVLTVEAIKALRNNPSLSRAQSLQAAMAKVRNDTSSDTAQDTWAHPNAWAPFSYVGAR